MVVYTKIEKIKVLYWMLKGAVIFLPLLIADFVDLLGSNLKFRMTEFGTLEILSTVETDKGEVEWSTSTEHRETSDTGKAESGKYFRLHQFSSLLSQKA